MLRELFNNNITAILILGILAISLFTLVIAVIYYIYSLNDKDNIVNKVKEYNESFYKNAYKEVKKNKEIVNIYNKLDLLLTRSQLKYERNFNCIIFILLMIEFFFLGYSLTLVLIPNTLAAIVVGGGSIFIPYMCVEILANRKSKDMRGQIISLIPILINNTKLSSGNIFDAIKRAVPKVKNPLQMYLQDFVDEYESGVSPETCFENLKLKVSEVRFNRLIDCLKIHLYKGGNVIVTLNNIHKEYLTREIEEDRRRKENAASAMGIYFCVFSNFLILYIALQVVPEIKEQLEKNKVLVALGIINIIISLIIGYKSTKISNEI